MPVQTEAPYQAPTLLVVDDRQENLVAMEALLENSAWQVRSAASGEAAGDLRVCERITGSQQRLHGHCRRVGIRAKARLPLPAAVRLLLTGQGFDCAGRHGLAQGQRAEDAYRRVA